MSELLRTGGALRREDRKGYRGHGFSVPDGASALRITFAYDPGQPFPHSLLTLSLFDPHGFRGAGHRYSPRQTIELGPNEATPGFVAGPLPAGEWSVEVDVHSVIARPDGAPNGYELLVETIPESRAGSAAPPLPGAPASHGPGWYRGELHLHTTHSDGQWSPAEMAVEARGRGLDFMFLTDHNTNTGIAELRLVEKALRFALPLPDDICTGCRWTHEDFDPGLADGVEVWGGLWNGPEEENPGCVGLWHHWLDAGHRLTATGATDAHHKKHWEGAVPLTYVYAEELSLSGILDAVRAGRTFVSSGPELEMRAVAADGREWRCQSLGKHAGP